jgi:hypothetical protein
LELSELQTKLLKSLHSDPLPVVEQPWKPELQGMMIQGPGGQKVIDWKSLGTKSDWVPVDNGVDLRPHIYDSMLDKKAKRAIKKAFVLESVLEIAEINYETIKDKIEKVKVDESSQPLPMEDWERRACTCHTTGSYGCPIHEDDYI